MYQETAFVSAEDSSKELSPEHRRLRFSFQFNDVKDRDQEYWPRRLAPGGGERRLSIDAPPECQPALSGFFRLTGEPRFRRHKHGAGAPRSDPL